MIEVFFLLSLFCSGHTNAKCLPKIERYDTRKECEEARLTEPYKNMFGNEITAKIKNNTVCFASIELTPEGRAALAQGGK